MVDCVLRNLVGRGACGGFVFERVQEGETDKRSSLGYVYVGHTLRALWPGVQWLNQFIFLGAQQHIKGRGDD